MAIRRYWFVLTVFGIVTAASVPLYLKPGTGCQPTAGGACGTPVSSPQGLLGVYDLAHPGLVKLYWLLTLPLALLAMALYYRRAGALRRLGIPLALAAALVVLSAALTLRGWNGFRSTRLEPFYLAVFHGGTPLLVMAFVLLALALTERSVTLLTFAFMFLGVAIVANTYDSFFLLHSSGLPLDESQDPHGLRQVPNIAVPSALLILGGAAAFLLGRRRRRMGR
jgi:hypothetical protein